MKAWDIDVRPDFTGLPPGSGSVAKGQEVWEAKCASCHGIFGESNEVFTPIAGGTGAQDVREGRVAALRRTDYPGRTTLMKLANVSTLWDYINRAMPWAQPKSLSVEEVYAATAYILHLGGVLPVEFVLSDANIREVQQRLPNRNGMTTAHAMWPGDELATSPDRALRQAQDRLSLIRATKPGVVPDTRATACMANCDVEPKVASLLPDHARNAHGNLAEQTRIVGAQRGADTTRPATAGSEAVHMAQAETQAPRASAPQQPAPASASADTAKSLSPMLQKYACSACHAPAAKLVGPSWSDVSKKHAGKADYLAGKIKDGGSGVWGAVPMPPQALSVAEARRIAVWLSAGAPP